MPIYEYRCEMCQEQFEQFVRSLSAQKKVICPRCGSENVQKMVSLFGTKSEAGSSSSLSCAPGSI